MRHLPTMRWSLILAAVGLTGCATDTTSSSAVTHWSEAEAPKENKVTFTTLSYTVYFAPAASTLSADELRQFEQFASSSIHPGDRVTIEFSRSDRAARAGLVAQRQKTIGRFLAKHSAEAVFDVAQVSRDEQTHNAAILRVGRYVVTPPRCPDWSKPDADDFTNTPPSNFGCAVTTNIGLMVADPADLVRGAGSGAADGPFAARGVELYRSGQLSKSLGGASGSGGQGGGGTESGGQGGGSGSGGGN